MKISSDFSQKSTGALSFKSTIHILDGGAHANKMEHFAKSVLKKTSKIDDLKMHEVECSKKAPALKMMDSVADKIRELSEGDKLKPGDYLSILGITPVPVLNLQDRFKSVLNMKTTINYRNVKAQKAMLLRFLQEIYDKRDKYKQDIMYMDGAKQNIEHTIDVIKLLNSLKAKGVKVFIPAGHGADNTIKWLAKQKNVSDELYYYIYTGLDKNRAVEQLLNEIKSKNYYDFNLLSLSDTNIVNVNGANNQRYIFSSEDNFANKNARGVYNFSPIRDNSGTVIGYGFHDTKTVDFPHDEFDEKERVKELNKFVGLPLREVLSGYKDDVMYKKLVQRGLSTSNLSDKLYFINDVFDENQIKQKKLNLLGKLINKEQNLVFDVNSDGQIVFNKTNCEGSERPSVFSMWGSCFATINAIKDDIISTKANEKNNVINPLFSNYVNILKLASSVLLAFMITGYRPKNLNKH